MLPLSLLYRVHIVHYVCFVRKYISFHIIEDYKIVKKILDYLGIDEFERKRPPPKLNTFTDRFDDYVRDDLGTVRMAKELGLNPKSLIKNIPNKSQNWKKPVYLWILEMYQEHKDKKL